MTPRIQALALRLRAVLAGPRAGSLAIGLAAVLCLSVVLHGFEADDHVLRGFLLRRPPWDRWAGAPLDLFRFYDGNPARTMSLVDHGFSPWWTDPSLSVMFFRPLSAFTHWVDFQLWPGVPALMHLQSLGWYVALVAVVSAIYRRVLGAGFVAGLAAVLYGVDQSHGSVVEWLANRNALVAGVFGMAALLLHDRARREGRALLSLGSAGCLALGLTGGEVALGAVAYLAAYAIFLDRAPLRARLAAFAPHVAVLALWVVAYRIGGFGARGSGIYLDPARSPVEFLGAAVARVPLLLQTELGGISPDLLIFLPSTPLWVHLGAIALVGVALVAVWPLRADPVSRFFALGALLSASLVASTFPSGRLLLLPGIGLLGLVSQVVEGVVDRTRSWRPGAPRACALFAAGWMGGGHLFLSPVLLQLALLQIPILEHVVSRYCDALGDDPALSGQRVVVVNTPDTFFAYYIIGQRLTSGRPSPAHLSVLASGRQGMEIERPDARSLLVRSDGGFYGTGTSTLTRSLSRPMPVGTRVPLTGVTVEVTKGSADGVPVEAVFRFDAPLEDPSLRWVEWRGPTFVPFALPAVGERRRIEAQLPPLFDR